jgi:DNA polymerase, archaea type
LGGRAHRQELAYEALLANGREHWAPGERVYVYRRQQGRAGLWVDTELDESGDRDADVGVTRADPRDYDVEHYVRQLRESFASRLARGVTPEDFEALVADPDRPSLFAHPLENARPTLTRLQAP